MSRRVVAAILVEASIWRGVATACPPSTNKVQEEVERLESLRQQEARGA